MSHYYLLQSTTGLSPFLSPEGLASDAYTTVARGKCSTNKSFSVYHTIKKKLVNLMNTNLLFF